MNFINRFIGYLKDVKSELGKVTWPSRQEAIKHTLIVIAISLAVAAFLGGIDLIFAYLLDKFVI